MEIHIPELNAILAKLDAIIELLDPNHRAGNSVADAYETPDAVRRKTSIMTVDQVAEYIGISKSTTYKYTSARMLPHLKIGNRLLFRTEEIEEWLEGKSVKVIGNRRR